MTVKRGIGKKTGAKERQTDESSTEPIGTNADQMLDPNRDPEPPAAILPPEGFGIFADGTPLDHQSLAAWRELKGRERIRRNSSHLTQQVLSWDDVQTSSIQLENPYDYYVVFMHIPKAGGTTLQHIIAKNYLPNFVVHANNPQISKNPACLFHIKRKAIKPVLMGHFDRSHFLYNLLCDRPIIHFTVFRDPVKRILSHYRYLQGNVVHGKHEQVKAMSLEEYARSSIREIQNKQTLRLLGDASQAALRQSLHDPAPLLKEAKRVLAEEFTFFGLTERYSEFLLMGQHLLKWQDILYQRKNVSHQPISKTIVSDSISPENDKKALQIIHERNQLDIRLYNFASELFSLISN